MHILCIALSRQNDMESVSQRDILPLWECIPHPFFEKGKVQLVVAQAEA